MADIALPTSLETIADELSERDASQYTPVYQISQETSDKGKILYKFLDYKTSIGGGIQLFIGKTIVTPSSPQEFTTHTLFIFTDDSGNSHVHDQSKLKAIYDVVHQKVSTDPARSEQERKFLNEFWR